MSWFNIEFPEPKVARRPGETIAGEATWTLSEPVASLKLKLAWRTTGQGAQADPVTVEEQTLDQPATEGRQAFTFTLPDGPWSFEGTLFSVEWYVELGDSEWRYKRGDFVLSPTGAPLQVRKPDPL